MFHSLRYKILAGYVLLVLILTLVGAWSIYNFSRLSATVTGITDRNYRSVLAAQHMTAALDRLDSAQLLLLLGETSRAQEIQSSAQADYLAWYSRAADNITEPGEGQIIGDLQAQYSEYAVLFTRFQELAATGRIDEARRLYLSDAEPGFNRLRALLTSLQDVNNSAFMAGNRDARANALQATWSTLAVAGVAVFLCLFLGFSLSETIVRPTLKLTETVRRVAQGSLREEIPVTGRDEIAELAGEFNQMVHRLRTYEETSLGQLLAERRKSDVISRVISDPVMALDDRYRILMLNPAAEAILGIDEHLSQSKPFLQAVNRPDIFARLQRALDGPLPGPDEEPPGPVEVGGRFFDLDAVPLEGPEGRTLGLIAVFRDVTRYKELDNLKSEFVSTVSHEFRTPLTTIELGTGMLAAHPAIRPGSREAEMLSAMTEETERLTRLVNDLLDLSRLESGRIDLDFRSVSLKQLLEHAVTPLRPQAEEKGIELALETDPEGSLVRVDPDQVLLVLTNLIGNALRYTPQGGKVVVQGLERAGRALISVIDTGPGVPLEAQKRIFEKFYRVKGRHQGGAGLGLAISREVVRAHGGRIWVQSEEGKGAAFYFTLPLAADKESRKGGEEEIENDPATRPGGG